MKKFTKEFLKEVLGFNQEEVKLTMECQRLFPELLENDGTKIESARKMYLDLGLNESNWSKWSKRNIIDNEFFKENVDWIPLVITTNADKSRVDGNFAKDYNISIEMAKHLCMMARTEKSHKFRQYFILIEKSIRGLQEHNFVREPEKKNYNIMKEAIVNDYCSRHSNVTKVDESCIMVQECNMINFNLLGYSASEVRAKLGYMDRQTREHLQIEQNKAIDFIQNIVTGLVISGMNFEERSKIISNICKNKYSHLRMDK